MSKRSWVVWFAVVTASVLTFLAVTLFLLVRTFRMPTPQVSEGSAVAIDLALDYPEDPLYDFGGPFFGVDRITFRDLSFAVSRAKEDDRVQKLFLHVRATGLGWAQATELRDQLLDFRSAGKKLVSFIEYGSNRDYFLASAADEIFMHPRAILDLRGVRAEMMFLASALDKLGVEPEFERVGAFKDSPDMYLADEMSPEGREALTALVETVHDVLVEAIVEGRGLGADEAKDAVASGPFTAGQAEERRLVDGIRHLDEVERSMAPEGSELETISVGDYRRATAFASPFGADARIALIYGVGTIVGGTSTEDAFFGRIMGSDTIAEAFESVREDDSIDAVVFRIDSPGGTDVASDVIWREAMRTKVKKPVVVSMGEVAASGGYWIATASDAIVAEPTTITGSIGIYGGKFNLSRLFDKLGVGFDGVETSENAEFFSANRSFTPEERERLREILESGYRAFLDRVAEARGMTVGEVDRVAQGRVWSGRMALEHGLVDEIGGLSRALVIAKEKAGFDADASVELRIYPEKRQLIELLLSSFVSGSVASALPPLDEERLFARSPMLRLAAGGAPLALMPFRIRIR